MLLGDVVDELHDKHGLAHTGTTKETDFTTLGIRFEQVDDFDTCIQYFLRCGKLFELRRFAMDGVSTFLVQLLHAVYGIAYYIHQAAFDLVTHRHGDRVSGRNYFHTSSQSVGTVHGYGAHGVLTDVLLNFDYEGTAIIALDGQRIMNTGKKQCFVNVLSFEIHIDYWPDNLGYMSFQLRHSYMFFIRY